MSQEEVFRNFLTEMGERLAEFEQCLAELELSFRMDTVHHLFRAIHTIKGGAGFFELGNITRLSHQLEDLLMKIREEELAKVIRKSWKAKNNIGKMYLPLKHPTK